MLITNGTGFTKPLLTKSWQSNNSNPWLSVSNLNRVPVGLYNTVTMTQYWNNIYPISYSNAEPTLVYWQQQFLWGRIPANTRHWTNVDLMLAHRLWLWANNKSALVQRLAFAGIKAIPTSHILLWVLLIFRKLVVGFPIYNACKRPAQLRNNE